MALGESAASVRRNVVGKTLVLALLGIAVGTAISLAGTNLISSLLYGIEPSDPLTFLTMIGVLLLVAVVSGLVPAIRASRTDSAGALRSVTGWRGLAALPRGPLPFVRALHPGVVHISMA